MGFLNRLFAKHRTASAATVADRARGQRLTDRARSQKLEGQETNQTAAEQAGTRSRMEAEMATQRERRERPPTPTA